jgi:hypothetical protein
MASWADDTASSLVVDIAAGPCGRVADVSSLQVCKVALPLVVKSHLEQEMDICTKARA